MIKRIRQKISLKQTHFGMTHRCSKLTSQLTALTSNQLSPYKPYMRRQDLLRRLDLAWNAIKNLNNKII